MLFYKRFEVTSFLHMNLTCSFQAAELIKDAVFKENRDKNILFFSPSQRLKVFSVFLKVKRQMNYEFNFLEFKKILLNLALPVEGLWSLHLSRLLPLQEALLECCNAKAFASFCLADSGDDPGAVFAQAGVMAFLVTQMFDPDTVIKEVCSIIMDLILEGLFSEKESLLRRQYLWDLWKLVEEPALRMFSSHLLHSFVKATGAATKMLDAISTQCPKDDNSSIIDKAVVCLGAEMGPLLLVFVQQDEGNWRNIFRIVRSLVTSSAHLVSGAVRQLLQAGFEQQDPVPLQKALLIGRQVALSSDTSFPSAFKHWMQGELVVRSNFPLLLQVLCSVVPYETDLTLLRALLEFPLRVPPPFHPHYSDYTALLKTRLKDLEPRIQPEKVLEKTLSTFLETGKVPQYILEASLVRKHQYLNEFLPVLLTPRVVPMIPDTLEKFIQELDRAKKIPGVMMEKYKEACREEERKLLEGVDLTEDFFMEDFT